MNKSYYINDFFKNGSITATVGRMAGIKSLGCKFARDRSNIPVPILHLRFHGKRNIKSAKK